MSKQTITRKGTFDSMHRVMNERMKCFNVHGHTYLFELTFGFSQMDDIGYAIDFKEIKRVGCQWIDDILDHGAILNPKDNLLIDAATSVDSKLYKMSLSGGEEYCNPSVENLVKELFIAQTVLFAPYEHLWIDHIRLYETPNCFTDCYKDSISDAERKNFWDYRGETVAKYRDDKGVVEYDDRKV